jgi:hypothetical protein
MTFAFLVTGSRSLAEIPGAREWATEILHRELVVADDIGPVLVTGDARGPDAWAIDVAKSIWMPYRQWCLDGWIRGAGESMQWAKVVGRGRGWPLVRNETMVRAVAKRASGARGIALIDPGSKTDGTGHTARHARAHGIVVDEFRWG